MNDCLVAQELCPIFRGDTINFDFELLQEDGSPFDISGMTMFFTAKQVANSVDALNGDLQAQTTFPSSADSTAGLGNLKVPAAQSDALVVGVVMHYDFQIVNGSDVTTLGFGTFKVAQDITIAVS